MARDRALSKAMGEGARANPPRPLCPLW